MRSHRPASIHVTGVASAILVAAHRTRLDASKPFPSDADRLVTQDQHGRYVQVMRREDLRATHGDLDSVVQVGVSTT